MKCPNISHPDYKKLVSAFGKEGAYKIYLANDEMIPPTAVVDALINDEVKQKAVKLGVAELFESNPELANEVYEALGIKQKFDTKGISIEFRDGSWNIIKLNGKRIGQFKFVDNGEKGSLSLSIQVDEDYQNKGYGQIVHIMAADLAKKEYNKSLYSDYQNSRQEIQLLKSLAKKGYAEQTGSIGTNSEEFPDTFNTTERAFRIKTSDEIKTITPQQKQEAQQLYSQYLDTIFPDSKVKDIVYRGGNLGTKQPQDVEAFTTSKSYAEYRAAQNNTKVYSAILNIQESKLIDKKETRTLSLDRDDFQYQDYGFTDNKDQTKQLGNFYTVKENNRHILGSKQDIEGFKEFVNKSTKKINKEVKTVNVSEALSSVAEIKQAIKNKDLDTVRILNATLNADTFLISTGQDPTLLLKGDLGRIFYEKLKTDDYKKDITNLEQNPFYSELSKKLSKNLALKVLYATNNSTNVDIIKEAVMLSQLLGLPVEFTTPKNTTLYSVETLTEETPIEEIDTEEFKPFELTNEEKEAINLIPSSATGLKTILPAVTKRSKHEAKLPDIEDNLLRGLLKLRSDIGGKITGENPIYEVLFRELTNLYEDLSFQFDMESLFVNISKNSPIIRNEITVNNLFEATSYVNLIQELLRLYDEDLIEKTDITKAQYLKLNEDVSKITKELTRVNFEKVVEISKEEGFDSVLEPFIDEDNGYFVFDSDISTLEFVSTADSSSNPLISLLQAMQEQNTNHINQEYGNFVNSFRPIYKAFSDKVKTEENPYTRFFQVRKDANGNSKYTGNIVTKTSIEYYDELGMLYKNMKTEKSVNEKLEPGNKTYNAAWKFYKFLSENNTFDVTEQYEEIEPSIPVDLDLLEFGFYYGPRQYVEDLKLFKNFTDYGKNFKEIAIIVNRLSSFSQTQFISQEVNYEVEDGKWLDDKWIDLQSESSEILNFYNFLIERTEQNYKILDGMRDSKGRNVKPNAIFDVKKTLAEEIAEDGIMATLLNKGSASIASVFGEYITAPVLNPFTGEVSYEPTLPIQQNTDLNEKSNNLANVLMHHTKVALMYKHHRLLYPVVQTLKQALIDAKVNKSGQLAAHSLKTATKMFDYLSNTYFSGDIKGGAKRILESDKRLLTNEELKKAEDIKQQIEELVIKINKKEEELRNSEEDFRKIKYPDNTLTEGERLDIASEELKKIMDKYEIKTPKYFTYGEMTKMGMVDKDISAYNTYRKTVNSINRNKTKKKTNLELELASLKRQLKGRQSQLDSLGRVVTGEAFLDSVNEYSRRIGLSWRVVTAVADMFQGVVNNTVEATGGGYFSWGSLTRAYMISIASKPSNFVQGKDRETKIEKFAKLLNIGRESYFSSKSIKDELGTTLFDKISNFDFVYTLQGISSTINNNSTMIAFLIERTININGKEIPIWDCFDDDLNFIYDEEFNPFKTTDEKGNFKPSSDLARLSSDMATILSNIHGNPDLKKTIMAKGHLLGRLLFVFKSWLPRMIKNRFGSEEYDRVLGLKKRGMFWSVFGKNGFFRNSDGKIKIDRILKNIAQLIKKSENGNLSKADLINLRKVMAEMVWIGGLMMFINVLKNASSGDDDEDMFQTYLINQNSRFLRDISLFYDPLQTIGATSFNAPIYNTFKNFYNLLAHTITQEEYESGYNYGQKKYIIEGLNQLPGISGLQSSYKNIQIIQQQYN